MGEHRGGRTGYEAAWASMLCQGGHTALLGARRKPGSAQPGGPSSAHLVALALSAELVAQGAQLVHQMPHLCRLGAEWRGQLEPMSI